MTVHLARVTISVTDLDDALDLYAGVLGLTVRYREPDLAMLATDEPAVDVLLHRRRAQPAEFGVAPTFAVDDVDGTAAAAVVAGATVIDAPEDQSWGERQAVLRDADGNVFCVVSPIPDEPPQLL
jgi:predicted enzyme related to lactoylglutathione lyase